MTYLSPRKAVLLSVDRRQLTDQIQNRNLQYVMAVLAGNKERAQRYANWRDETVELLKEVIEVQDGGQEVA